MHLWKRTLTKKQMQTDSPFLDTSSSTRFSKFWMSGGSLCISLSLKPSFLRRCRRKKFWKQGRVVWATSVCFSRGVFRTAVPWEDLWCGLSPTGAPPDFWNTAGYPRAPLGGSSASYQHTPLACCNLWRWVCSGTFFRLTRTHNCKNNAH